MIMGGGTSSPLLLGEGTSSPPRKKSCHEENDSKKEESLSCLLLSGCHLIYVKDFTFELCYVLCVWLVYRQS